MSADETRRCVLTSLDGFDLDLVCVRVCACVWLRREAAHNEIQDLPAHVFDNLTSLVML